MRVSEALIYRQLIRHNSSARNRLETASLPLMTGENHVAPSEDPVYAQQVEQARRSSRRSTQYRDNIDRVRLYYQLTETTVSNTVDALSELSTLAVQMSNGALDADDRATAAQSVEHIIDTLKSISNTKHDGRYIFSGRLQDQPSYDAANNFLGDAIGRTVPVGDGFDISADLTGPEVFGDPAAGETTAFEAAEMLHAALINNDSGDILDALEAVKAAHSKAVSAWSHIGMQVNDLDRFDTYHQEIALSHDTQLAEMTGVDIAEAASEYQFAEQIYQSSLSTSQQLMEILRISTSL